MTADELLTDHLSYLPSLTARAAYLYNNKLLSDVSFVVGFDASSVAYFSAHRFFLAIVSPVFQKMFESQMAETCSGADVRVTDISPCTFKMLLRYIYTDDVSLESVRNALDLLYAAQKYMLYHLSSCCIEYLENVVNADTVLDIYTEVKLYGNEYHGNLLMKCLQIIDKKADRVLSSPSFLALNAASLQMICSREHMHVSSELVVFDAISKWALHQCHQRKLAPTPENRRAMLGNALYCVQYLAMSCEEYLEGPATNDLVPEEIRCYFLRKVCGEPEGCKPKSLEAKLFSWKRKGYATYSAALSSRTAWGSTPSVAVSQRLSICADQDVILLGFDLNGVKGLSMGNYYAGLRLEVSDSQDNEIAFVSWKPGHNQVVKDQKLFIGLGTPILLNKSKEYLIHISLPKGEYLLRRMKQGKKESSYECRKVSFTLKNVDCVNSVFDNAISLNSSSDVPEAIKANQTLSKGRTLSVFSNMKFYF